MAIALVASTKKATAGASPAIDTTGANLLVALLVASGSPTLTDSKGNTWTKLTEQTGPFGEKTALYYVPDPVVGSGHTFTIGGTFPSGCFAAYSGVKATTPHDAEDTGVGTSVLSPGSITPSEDNELVILTLGGFHTAISVNTGTIIQNNDGSGGVNFSSTLAELIQTTAAAVNPAWTFSGGNSGQAATNCFKAAAAAGRTTKNTRAFPLGVEVGMNHLQCNI